MMPRTKTVHSSRTALALILAACAIGLTLAACDSRELPAQPTPTQPPVTPPRGAVVRALSVGEVVEDSVSWNDPSCTSSSGRITCRWFSVTAPRDGTLVARVSWDVYYWDTLLQLRVGDTVIPSVACGYSPIVGRSSVVAGRTYHLGVGLCAAGSLPVSGFTLTTEME
jgi:hypothetical protein